MMKCQRLTQITSLADAHPFHIEHCLEFIFYRNGKEIVFSSAPGSLSLDVLHFAGIFVVFGRHSLDEYITQHEYIN